MAPRAKKAVDVWKPHGCAKLTPSLPVETIISMLTGSSKHFSKVLKKKESTLGKRKGRRSKDSADGSIEEDDNDVKELRNKALGAAYWMKTIMNEEYMAHESEQLNLVIALNMIKITAITCPDYPFATKDDAVDVLGFIMELFPKAIDIRDDLHKDYMELLKLWENYDMQTIITEWIGEENVELTEKLINVLLKSAEVDTRQSLSIEEVRLVTDVHTSLEAILERCFISMPAKLETIDTVIYSLTTKQREQFPNSYKLCKRVLRKEECAGFVGQITKTLQEMLNTDCVFGGVKTGDKIWNVIVCLEQAVPGYIANLLEDILKHCQGEHCERAKHCLLNCAIFPNAPISSLVKDPKVFLTYDKNSTASLKKWIATNIVKLVKTNPNWKTVLSKYIFHCLNDNILEPREILLKNLGLLFQNDLDILDSNVLERVSILGTAKDESIRQLAMKLIGQLNKVVQKESFKDGDKDRMIWLSANLFNCLIHSNLNDVVRMEKTLVSCILVPSMSSQKRYEYLAKMFICLNSNGLSSFRHLIRSRYAIAHAVLRFAQYWSDGRHVGAENKLYYLFENAYLLEDSQDVFRNLEVFCTAMKETNVLTIFQNLLSTFNRSIVKVESELGNILSKVKTQLNESQYNCFKLLLERCAPLIINDDFAEYLLTNMIALENEKDPGVKKCYYATMITDMISSSYSFAFFNESSMENLIKLAGNFKIEPFSEMAILIFKRLFCLDLVCNVNEDLSKRIVDVCSKCIFNGSARGAKNAIIVIDKMKKYGVVDGELLDQLYNKSKAGLNIKSCQYARSIMAIGQMLVINPSIDKEQWTAKVSEFIKNVMGSEEVTDVEYYKISWSDLRTYAISQQDDENKDAFERMYGASNKRGGIRMPLTNNQFSAFPIDKDPQIVNKICTIKFLKKLLIAVNDGRTAVAMSIIHFYQSILNAKESILENTGQTYQTALCYYAASSLLCLRHITAYVKNVTFKYTIAVSTCLYDFDYDARNRLVDKLVNAIRTNSGVFLLSLLPMVFYSPDTNVSIETEESFRIVIGKLYQHLVAKFYRSMHYANNKPHLIPFFVPEYVIAFVIVILANNANFTKTTDLNYLKKVEYVMQMTLYGFESNANKANYSVLNEIICQVKRSILGPYAKMQVPGDGKQLNEKMWVLAEFADAVGETMGIFSNLDPDAPEVFLPKYLFDSNSENQRTKNLVTAESMNTCITSFKKQDKMRTIVEKSLQSFKAPGQKSTSARGRPRKNASNEDSEFPTSSSGNSFLLDKFIKSIPPDNTIKTSKTSKRGTKRKRTESPESRASDYTTPAIARQDSDVSAIRRSSKRLSLNPDITFRNPLAASTPFIRAPATSALKKNFKRQT
uniref:SCD domain-containing protein n=1 Tax=Rhabditophanes sp. KR3021 TaxID=114890 RepID=A0AC35UAP0_9BILA